MVTPPKIDREGKTRKSGSDGGARGALPETVAKGLQENPLIRILNSNEDIGMQLMECDSSRNRVAFPGIKESNAEPT